MHGSIKHNVSSLIRLLNLEVTQEIKDEACVFMYVNKRLEACAWNEN